LQLTDPVESQYGAGIHLLGLDVSRMKITYDEQANHDHDEEHEEKKE
jgi:hypothetical protein